MSWSRAGRGRASKLERRVESLAERRFVPGLSPLRHAGLTARAKFLAAVTTGLTATIGGAIIQRQRP